MINTLVRQSSIAMIVASLLAVPVAAQDSGIEVGAKAPPAALHTLDGKPVNIARLLAKGPVLLDFWATWCENCQELEPAMKALHKKYGSKVTFVGVAVSVNQSPALVRRYVTKHKMAWPQYYDTKGHATKAYDVPATSYIVLVDKAGKVVYTGIGGTQDRDLEAAIKKMMQ